MLAGVPHDTSAHTEAVLAICRHLNSNNIIKYVTYCHVCHVRMHGPIDVPRGIAWDRDVPFWSDITSDEQCCFNIGGTLHHQLVFGIDVRADDTGSCIGTKSAVPWIEVRVIDVLPQLTSNVIVLCNVRTTYCAACVETLLERQGGCNGEGQCFERIGSDSQWERKQPCIRDCQLITCMWCKQQYPRVRLGIKTGKTLCLSCDSVECRRRQDKSKSWKACDECGLMNIKTNTRRTTCAECSAPVASCRTPGCIGKVDREWKERCYECCRKYGNTQKKTYHCITVGCKQPTIHPTHIHCPTCYKNSVTQII